MESGKTEHQPDHGAQRQRHPGTLGGGYVYTQYPYIHAHVCLAHVYPNIAYNTNTCVRVWFGKERLTPILI